MIPKNKRFYLSLVQKKKWFLRVLKCAESAYFIIIWKLEMLGPRCKKRPNFEHNWGLEFFRPLAKALIVDFRMMFFFCVKPVLMFFRWVNNFGNRQPEFSPSCYPFVFFSVFHIDHDLVQFGLFIIPRKQRGLFIFLFFRSVPSGE